MFDSAAHQHDCYYTLLLEVDDKGVDDDAEGVDDEEDVEIVVEPVVCIHVSIDLGSWTDTGHVARALEVPLERFHATS